MGDNAIDYNKIKHLILKNYDVGCVEDIICNDKGWGENYEIVTKKGQYFLKIIDRYNPLYHIDDEIEVCGYLNSIEIKTSQFVKTRNGLFMCNVNEETVAHLQKFIKGDVWKKNSAPDWLLEEGVQLLSNIHNSLQHFTLDIRSSILEINNSEKAVVEIKKLIKEISLIEIDEKSQILNDLNYRLNAIKNQKYIELDKLTFVNSHSDFSITQLITNGKFIEGIIDFTEVSSVPAGWEILRFYLDSSTECCDGNIDICRFRNILNIYERKRLLNEYDKEILFEMYYIYLCRATSVYKNIVKHKSNKFVERSKIRMKKIKYLEKNKDLLTSLLRT